MKSGVVYTQKGLTNHACARYSTRGDGEKQTGQTHPHCLGPIACPKMMTEQTIVKNFRVVVIVVQTSGLKLLIV